MVAGEIGVSALYYKDEGQRFGIKSFKPLGGGYAVARILARAVTESGHTGVVDSKELLSGRHRDTMARVTGKVSIRWDSSARLFGLSTW